MSSETKAINPDPEYLFITGVTGFIGAFLLRDLLEHTNARIYCLVRAANYRLADERIEQNMKHFKCWDLERCHRIIPVVGDLSRPLFGMSERDFDQCAERVDAVYHNGAYVNFVVPYSRLKAANVLGTQEALRLASRSRVKPLHYTSTLRVFGSFSGNEDGLVTENDVVDQQQVIESGYSQSKWVAEKMVKTAGTRGIPVTIFRPGMVTGDTVNGMANFDDIIGRMIKGCIQIGCAPKKEMLLDFTPVDFVSRAMVHLSMQEESLGKAFHMVTPKPIDWNDLVVLIRELGYPLRTTSYESWLEEIQEVIRQEKPGANALAPLMSYFRDEMPDEVANRVFDCSNALEGLKGSGIQCPEVDLELLRTYFGAYIENDFLDRPPVGELSPAAA